MLRIELEREEDGRWARARATALALRVIADRLLHGEPIPEIE